MLRCRVCGGEAAYLDSQSGDPLCTRCLEKRLLRYIRKCFSRYNLAGGKHSVEGVALLVTPWTCSLADAATRLLEVAERGHTGWLHVLLPSTCNCEPKGPWKLEVTVTRYEPPEVGSVLVAERVARRIAAELTKAELIAVLSASDDGALLLLDALAHYPPGVADAHPRVGGRFVRPLALVPREALVAYAYLTGRLCNTSEPSPSPLTAALLAASGPEHRMSYLRVAERLTGQLERLLPRCEYCGGLYAGRCPCRS